jgi:type I restriction enzyme S subunit
MPLFRIYDRQHISVSQNIKAVNLCRIKRGDVLVTRSGTVGRIGLVSSRMDGWAASEHMIRITPRSEVYSSGFLYGFLSTPYGQHQIKARIYGGVVDELTDADLANCLIPDVPIEIQKSVGEKVTAAFELRDRANDLEDGAITAIESLIESSE